MQAICPNRLAFSRGDLPTRVGRGLLATPNTVSSVIAQHLTCRPDAKRPTATPRPQRRCHSGPQRLCHDGCPWVRFPSKPCLSQTYRSEDPPSAGQPLGGRSLASCPTPFRLRQGAILAETSASGQNGQLGRDGEDSSANGKPEERATRYGIKSEPLVGTKSELPWAPQPTKGKFASPRGVASLTGGSNAETASSPKAEGG